MKLLFKSTSVTTMGIPVLDGMFQELRKPGHIYGLVDTAHYAALQAADPELAATLL
jgi:hypothetical protein